MLHWQYLKLEVNKLDIPYNITVGIDTIQLLYLLKALCFFILNLFKSGITVSIFLRHYFFNNLTFCQVTTTLLLNALFEQLTLKNKIVVKQSVTSNMTKSKSFIKYIRLSFVVIKLLEHCCDRQHILG